LKTAGEFPLQEPVEQLVSAADGISSVVDSREFRKVLELLNHALVNLRDLTASLNEELAPLTYSLQQTPDGAGAAIADLRIMMRKQDGDEVLRIAESIERRLPARQTAR